MWTRSISAAQSEARWSRGGGGEAVAAEGVVALLVGEEDVGLGGHEGVCWVGWLAGF